MITQKIGQIVLLICLISCSAPKYWTIQHDKSHLVNNKDDEIINCRSPKVKQLVCLAVKDLILRCGK